MGEGGLYHDWVDTSPIRRRKEPETSEHDVPPEAEEFLAMR